MIEKMIKQIMTREEMIKQMKGNYIDVDYEWLMKNDPEMLDWVCKSDYWGRGFEKAPSREKAWLRLEFDEGGIRYIATTADEIDVHHSLGEQPPWGEDHWEDWKTEDIQKYYMLVKNNINIK
jgi:hypothetical protein